jgi:vancomycin resistance protein YoaR
MSDNPSASRAPEEAEQPRAGRTRSRRKGPEAPRRAWLRPFHIAPSTRTFIVRSGLLIGSGFALLLLAAVIERVAYSGQVLPGVEIEGIDAEGRSERDVRHSLEVLADRLETAPLQARASDTDLEADPSAVRLAVDRETTLRAARKVGRSHNPFDAVGGFVLRRVRHERVDLEIDYSAPGIEGLLDGWQSLVHDGVQEGDLRFDGTTVVVVAPRAGTGIVRDEAQRKLIAMLESATRRRLTFEVGRIEPTVDLEEVQALAARARRILQRESVVSGPSGTAAPIEIPAPGETPALTETPGRIGTARITIAPEDVAGTLDARVRKGAIELRLDPVQLSEALGNEVAVFTTRPVAADFGVQPDNSVRIIPSVNGRELDLRKVAKAILAEHHAIDAPFKIIRPERDTAWAKRLGIKEVVSSFTTHHPCCAARVTNIHTAALLMDNTVVEPGQVFSLNDVVGPRTPERGFVSAPVFYGEFTEDFGGGVSQIATTTFNAAFWGGFEIVDHKPHSVYFTRYPMGREATVNYPEIDLRWRNDSKHGVLVKTSFTDESITVTLFGDREGRTIREENEDGTCSVGPSFDTLTEERCHVVLAELPVERLDVPCDKATSLDDPDGDCATLAPGQTEHVADGHPGYIVELWRIIERPGQAVERKRFGWQYQMYPNKFLVGVSKESPTTTTPGPTPTTIPGTTTTPTTAPTSSSAPTTTTS